MKKNDLEKVKLAFKSKGYTVLDSEYKNGKQKLHIIDENGYRYYVNYNSLLSLIKSGGYYEKFLTTNPYTIKNIKLYISKNNIDIELLSDEYIHAKSKMSWKCSCGKCFERTMAKVLTCKQYTCYECAIKTWSDKNKISMEDKNRLIKEYNITPLEDITDKRIVDKISFINNEGYKFRTSLISMKMTNGGQKLIGKDNPYSLENINLYIKKNNIKFKAIKFNSSKSIDCKCDICEHVFNRAWSTIKSSTNDLCPMCTNKEIISTYSKLTKKWLDDNNIEYEMEKKFDTCKNIFKLPFDYYLKDYNLCIEVDGEYHYKPLKKWNETEEESIEAYKNVVKRDEIKTKWCKENNIKLLRLPYYLFNKKSEYIKVLEDNVKYCS